MPRFDTLNEHFIDYDGSLLIGGKVFFFEAGTSTEKDTFKDPALTIENTNPIILTGAGKWPFQVWFDGTAQIILQDSQGQQIENTTPLGGDVTSNAFADYNNQIAYSANDIVIGSDGRYYSSISGDNINNDPTATSGFWMEIFFINDFELTQSYLTNQIVIASDGGLYRSLIDSNLGNDPTSSPTEWVDVTQNITGINDITTGVRLELTDAGAIWGTSGADYHHHHVEDDQSIEYLGGRSDSNAAGLRVFGHLHATQANDAEFLANGAVHTQFDFSTTTWDYGSNTITTTGPLNCGAFTSLGIRDLAPGRRVQVSDTSCQFGELGVSYNIRQASNSQILKFQGGNAGSAGGGLNLYGGAHASLANNVELLAGGVVQQAFSDSGNTWDFKANDILTSGNFVPASGSGIDFSATADGSGTTTSELLDDYEEGTWTPLLTDGSNNATLSTAVGEYTKIGNRVMYSGRFIANSLGSMSGPVFIDGLPFVSGGQSASRHTVTINSAANLTITSGETVTGRISVGLTTILLQLWDSGSGTTNFDTSEMQATVDMSFSGSYTV